MPEGSCNLFGIRKNLQTKVYTLHIFNQKIILIVTSTETWEVVLKLLLGTCDCLLGGERGADELQTKAIAPFLLKVVFEVWLHARTTDPVLWDNLVKLVFCFLAPLVYFLLTLLFPNSNFSVDCEVVTLDAHGSAMERHHAGSY